MRRGRRRPGPIPHRPARGPEHANGRCGDRLFATAPSQSPARHSGDHGAAGRCRAPLAAFSSSVRAAARAATASLWLVDRLRRWRAMRVDACSAGMTRVAGAASETRVLLAPSLARMAGHLVTPRLTRLARRLLALRLAGLASNGACVPARRLAALGLAGLAGRRASVLVPSGLAGSACDLTAPRLAGIACEAGLLGTARVAGAIAGPAVGAVREASCDVGGQADGRRSRARRPEPHVEVELVHRLGGARPRVVDCRIPRDRDARGFMAANYGRPGRFPPSRSQMSEIPRSNRASPSGRGAVGRRGRFCRASR